MLMTWRSVSPFFERSLFPYFEKQKQCALSAD
jgi:hypothetical protein